LWKQKANKVECNEKEVAYERKHYTNKIDKLFIEGKWPIIIDRADRIDEDEVF
jgi:hypothetical protein